MPCRSPARSHLKPRGFSVPLQFLLLTVGKYSQRKQTSLVGTVHSIPVFSSLARTGKVILLV